MAMASRLMRSVLRQAPRIGMLQRTQAPAMAPLVRLSSGKVESDAEFDARYVAYFNRKDIDGWEVRKAMDELNNMDLVPEPEVVAAALRACRRINDYSLTTRFLESIRLKCGPKLNVIWPYLLQELRPTLDELGISTPEELGYDKPEFAVPSPLHPEERE